MTPTKKGTIEKNEWKYVTFYQLNIHFFQPKNPISPQRFTNEVFIEISLNQNVEFFSSKFKSKSTNTFSRRVRGPNPEHRISDIYLI